MLFAGVKYKRNVIFSACLFIGLFSFNCKNENNEAGKLKNLNFNIDTTCIASEVILKDYKLSFNPPLNLAHSDEFYNKLSENIKQNNQVQTELITKPVDAFVDDKFNVLIVSSIESGQKDSQNSSFEKISDIVKKQFKSENVKFAEYLKDDIKISQFLIQDSINVIFKLLLASPNKQVMQFDYIIPQQNYKNEIKAIESSIGSIKYIKKES